MSKTSESYQVKLRLEERTVGQRHEKMYQLPDVGSDGDRGELYDLDQDLLSLSSRDFLSSWTGVMQVK